MKRLLKDPLLLSIIFFITTIIVLGYRINSYPRSLYNWEEYTTWVYYEDLYQETHHINWFTPLKILDGLMTDSGYSPFLRYPIRILFQLWEPTFFALRIFPVFWGAVTIIVFFHFVKRYFQLQTALIATCILLFSQTFMLYARTATVVGLSLLPSIVLLWLSIELLKKPRFVYALGIIFITFLNTFLYAMLRLFIPFVVGVLMYATLKRTKRLIPKITLLVGFLTIIVVNLTTFLPFWERYYHGRGEHIIEEVRTNQRSMQAVDEYILPNILDLSLIMYNIDRKPSFNHFFNSSGQLLSSFVVPFFFLGVILSTTFYKKTEHIVMFLWLGISTIPVIFTSNVHIGRLILSLPIISIFSAIGIVSIMKFVEQRFHTRYISIIMFSIISAYLAVLGTTQFHAFYTQSDYRDNPYGLAEELHTEESQSMIILNTDSLSLHFWQLVFMLQYPVEIRNMSQILDPVPEAGTQVVYGIRHNADIKRLDSLCGYQLPIAIIGDLSEEDIAFIDSSPCRERVHW